MFGGQHSDADAKPMNLKDISAVDEPRIDMMDEELNRVLGGGMVPVNEAERGSRLKFFL